MPPENANPLFIEKGRELIRVMVEVGLPAG
jgi:hypothetical protein